VHGESRATIPLFDDSGGEVAQDFMRGRIGGMADDLEATLDAAQERINLAEQSLQEAKNRLTIVCSGCSSRLDPRALAARDAVSEAAIAYSNAVMGYSALIRAKHGLE
jgi:hypothetical protein